ncbi:IS30 family transposase [Yoonia maritima]|uniref:IS30 family transposase n=1 Tax=Yoonia maritima TaxID=1435347 RepID=UPI0037370627
MIDLLKNGWTPEQIGNRIIHEQAPLRVCQETIYRYIYSKEGQRDDMWWELPTHRVARRSITFDRGTEFVSRPHLQVEISTQTWFCGPSSPWQKGTVENTNRRLRRWLPRNLDIRSMTEQDMKESCDRLNNTPGKCLGWKTPTEVFREKMVEEMR